MFNILIIMELTDKKEKELRKDALAAAMKVLPTDHKPSNRQFPNFKGDDYTLTVTDDTKVENILIKVESDNANISDWAAVQFDGGARLSYRQLFARANNGLGLDGATDDERMQNFIVLAYKKGKISVKIKDVKYRPNSDGGQRSYLFFEPLS